MATGKYCESPPPWAAGFAAAVAIAPLLLHLPPLRVGLPCCGIDGFGTSLGELGIKYTVEWAFDTNNKLQEHLLRYHGSLRNFFLGPVIGDITQVNISQLPSVQAILSGPPCPPWSSLGRRAGALDPRAAVFDHVVQMILEQIHRQTLLFFVLENVDPTGSGGGSYMHTIIAMFAVVAPTWYLKVVKMNAAEHGLAQSRKRAFLIGFPARLLRDSIGFPAQIAAGPTPCIGDFLRKDLPNASPASRQGKLNLAKYMACVVGKFGGRAGWLCCDTGRDPDARFGAFARYDNVMPTLTTTNIDLYVASVNQNPEVFRRLHHTERAVLQGFASSHFRNMAQTQACLFLGNAVPPVLCGKVVACIMQLLLNTDMMYHSLSGPAVVLNRISEQLAVQVPK